MNRDDIIRMAREAGAMFGHIPWLERDLEPVFQRFAALVAAGEREECAKVCEEWFTPNLGREATAAIAAAIRARGTSEDR